MPEKKDADKLDKKLLDTIRTQAIAAASANVTPYREANAALNMHIDAVYKKKPTAEAKKDKDKLTVEGFIKKYGTKEDQEKLRTLSDREDDLYYKIRNSVDGVLKENGLDYFKYTDMITGKEPPTAEERKRLTNNRALFDSIMDGLLHPKPASSEKGKVETPAVPAKGKVKER